VRDLGADARRPVAPAARLAAYEGDMRRIVGNGRAAFRMGIGWKDGPPPADQPLEVGSEIGLLVGASRKCYVVVYSYNAERDVKVSWPPADPATGQVKPYEFERGREPIVGRVRVPLGPEYLVAVGWTDRSAAVEMLSREPKSLDELGEIVKDVAASRSGVGKASSAEPKRLSLDDLLLTSVSSEVSRMPAGQTPEYSTAWLVFRTGR